MKKGRLEAFTDAVMAIIITIMVLEMKAPENTRLEALVPALPVFLSYVLSFIYIAIYWINHHRLFEPVEIIDVRVLWANINLLFWLSLIPFVTSWMGENHLEALPVALYGFILLMSAIAYRILEVALIHSHSKTSLIVRILGGGRKEKFSIVIYILGMATAFIHVAIGIACYVLVTIVWIFPVHYFEKYRIEKPE